MDLFDTPNEAIAFAKRLTRLLEVENFSETLKLSTDTADVYGIEVDGTGWYVKLYIDTYEPNAPEASFISLHPLERALQTNAGVVLP